MSSTVLRPAPVSRGRHARRLALLALALSATSAVQAASPVDACTAATGPFDRALVDVPFEVVDGRIYVAATANDAGPFRFAVDTGASGLARVDARLVDALGLMHEGHVANSDGLHTAQAATTRLRTLTLGGLRHEDVSAITRDYNARQSADAAFDGILARGFFADGLLTIDYPKRRLSFRRDAALSPSQPDTLGYTRAFRIPLSIGALTVEAQLDTGANVGLVMPAALHARMADAPVTTADRLTLAYGDIDGGRARIAGPIRIGGLTLADAEVRVSSDYPELVIGAHALQDAVVLIDQRTQRVAICPPPTAASQTPDTPRPDGD